MSILQHFIPENIVEALGWTVIHSLWQGVLLAAVFTLILTAYDKRSAAFRYKMALGGLLLMLPIALTTFLYYYQAASSVVPTAEEEAILSELHKTIQQTENQSVWKHLASFFEAHLPFIVNVWLIGVLFFSMRLAGGLWYVQRLRFQKNTPLSSDWQARLHTFRNHLGIRRSIALVESAAATVPMVVGWVKPMILLPIGTVNNLSTAQVEAILAHELAHIAGRDYLVNIAQSIVEALFYYHPAVWWLSAIVRAERENRCDDIAVALTGNSLEYAKALLQLQEMAASHVQTFGLAMTFAGKKKNVLLNRIKRILNQPQNRSNVMEKLFATALLMGAATAFAFSPSANTPPQYAQDLRVEMTADSTKPITISVIQEKIDGREIELTMRNNEIALLKIDGKTIPESEYKKYADLIKPIMENVPPPPPPPPAPFAPNAPRPPRPPKAPNVSIWQQKDSSGVTRLIVDKGNGSKSEIEVRGNELYLDGKKMEAGRDFAIEIPKGGYEEVFDIRVDDRFEFRTDDEDMPRPRIFINGDEGVMREEKVIIMKGDSNETAKWRSKGGTMRIEIDREQIRREAEQVRRSAEEVRREFQENHNIEIEQIKEEARRAARDAKRQVEIIREHRPIVIEREGGKSPIERELEHDGFSKNGKYKFDLNEKRLEINGKKMPEEIFQKYKKLYLREARIPAEAKFHVEIDKE